MEVYVCVCVCEWGGGGMEGGGGEGEYIPVATLSPHCQPVWPSGKALGC